MILESVQDRIHVPTVIQYVLLADVNYGLFQTEGFSKPILVPSMEGLGLRSVTIIKLIQTSSEVHSFNFLLWFTSASSGQRYISARSWFECMIDFLRVPSPTFTVDDVMDHVGEDREVPVMNSLTQATEVWNMALFADYYSTPPAKRQKVHFSLSYSLELSSLWLSIVWSYCTVL